LPCSTSCITATQVNSLEVEPGRNSVVCGVDRHPLLDVLEAIALGEDRSSPLRAMATVPDGLLLFFISGVTTPSIKASTRAGSSRSGRRG
jgi:hypothetical protein